MSFNKSLYLLKTRSLSRNIYIVSEGLVYIYIKKVEKLSSFDIDFFATIMPNARLILLVASIFACLLIHTRVNAQGWKMFIN